MKLKTLIARTILTVFGGTLLAAGFLFLPVVCILMGAWPGAVVIWLLPVLVWAMMNMDDYEL